MVGQPGPEVVVVERSQAAGSREHALVCEATDDGEHGVGELEPVSGSRVGCDEAMQSLTGHLEASGDQSQRRVAFGEPASTLHLQRDDRLQCDRERRTDTAFEDRLGPIDSPGQGGVR